MLYFLDEREIKAEFLFRMTMKKENILFTIKSLNFVKSAQVISIFNISNIKGSKLVTVFLLYRT
jgi:hypothetical protein